MGVLSVAGFEVRREGTWGRTGQEVDRGDDGRDDGGLAVRGADVSR